MRRGLIALAAGCAALLTVYVTLASFTPQSSNLGAGSAAVLSCDTDGVGIVYDLQHNDDLERWEVVSVQLSDVAPTCFGGTLNLVLVNATGVALGNSGPVAVSQSSFTVNIAPDPEATLVAGVRLVIVGP